MVGQLAHEVGAHHQDEVVPTRLPGELRERVQEGPAFRRVRAGGPHLLQLVHHQHRSRRRAGAEDELLEQVRDLVAVEAVVGQLPVQRDPGQLADGMAPGAHHQLGPGLAPGQRPACSIASRPARTSEDFPLPEAPTTASTRLGGSPGEELGHQPLAAGEPPASPTS